MNRRVRHAGVTAAVTALLLTGCGGPSATDEGGGPANGAGGGPANGAGGGPHCAAPSGEALGLAIARRANTAAAIPPQVRLLVVDHLRGIPASEPGDPPGPPLILVNVDGRPSVHWRQTFASYGATDEAVDFDRLTFLTMFDSALQDMRAVAPEVDVLEALAVAGRAVKAAGSGTVVLVDSGLSTAGLVDFTSRGMLDASPDDVVASLRDRSALPDLTGLWAVLVLGETAEPQDPLDLHYRRKVLAIWQAVATAAGACVTLIDDSAPAAPALEGLPPVTEVPIPGPPALPSGCSAVLADAGPLTFEEGRDDFRDPGAAREQLAQLAAVLLAQDCPTLMLTGTTAHWRERDLGYHIRLGEDRAERVKAELEDLGVPADRLMTRGVGFQFTQYVPDNDARGLLPGPAQQNRTVRIAPCTPDCPPA